MTLAWRTILNDLGSRLPLAAAVRVMSISQIAKYLPGVIWVFAAQIELGRDYQIDRRRSVAAVVVALAVALGTALLVATATLPIASSGAAHHYWWFMAIAPIVAICLAPPVLRRLLDIAFALARRQPLERPPSSRGLIIAVCLTTLGWLCWGLHAWLLIGDIADRNTSTALLALGGYALAWSAGILLVLFPGGLGPRELAFVIVLAPVMPRGSALLIALMSRVVMTASDVAWACAGVIIGRVTRHSRAPATSARGILHVGKHRKPRTPRLRTQPGLLPPATPGWAPTPDQAPGSTRLAGRG